MATDQEFYTPRQLADLLQLDERTVRRWRIDGGGPLFVRVGGSVRYRKSDVEAWIKDNTQETTDGRKR